MLAGSAVRRFRGARSTRISLAASSLATLSREASWFELRSSVRSAEHASVEGRVIRSLSARFKSTRDTAAGLWRKEGTRVSPVPCMSSCSQTFTLRTACVPHACTCVGTHACQIGRLCGTCSGNFHTDISGESSGFTPTSKRPHYFYRICGMSVAVQSRAGHAYNRVLCLAAA